MSDSTGSSHRETVSPEQAFSILGNDIRVEILRTLGAHDEPLSFTELRNHVGIRQGGQFNYHLEKLVGHFVAKTDAGYELRQPGRRVVQAVLSGAVTEDPMMPPTPVDWWPCPYCGGQVVVGYQQERVERYCTECDGLLGATEASSSPFDTEGLGSLQALYLPPAGTQGRDPSAILRAAFIWGYSEWLVAAHDVCPRCSAVVERTVYVCDDHEADGFCPACGRLDAVSFEAECSNCRFSLSSIASMHLAASSELLDFVTDHGVNPVCDPWDWGWEYEEELLSTDPLEARFAFTLDDETLTLTVDEHLDVVEASRGPAA
ncbi:MAG: winged helix-turn-helix domain-containing protein [Halobacteriota archaeon]